MRFRENRVGYGTITKPEGLIVGIKVRDGKFFPDHAKFTQRADFENYFCAEIGFKATPLYVEFQKAILPFAHDVAHVVNNAPPWDADWINPVWNDNVIASIKMPGRPVVSVPSIT